MQPSVTRRRGRNRQFGVCRTLRFESLEPRNLLATFTVTNLTDAPVSAFNSAPGTLRQALYDANHTAGNDVIEFAPALAGGTVELSLVGDNSLGPTALVVTSDVTIRGNAGGITIGRQSAGPEMRLLLVANDGDLTLETITLSGGVARGSNGLDPGQPGGDGRGGAIYNLGTVEIVASTLSGNFAIGGNAAAGGTGGSASGGAIYNDQATVVITNSTISGNGAQSGSGAVVPSNFGGGIYSFNGSLTVRNSSLTNQSASAARCICVVAANGTATLDLRSSIVGQWGDGSSALELSISPDTGGQLVVSGGNNLIRRQNDFEQLLTLSTDDPLLGPLAANGGPTKTHALLEGSPAINVGDNSLNLSADQRGGSFARVVGPAADIGSYEDQTASGPAQSGDYNQNGWVDAADYVLWRKTLNATVPPCTGADGNGNGQVDAGDYQVWRSNFGTQIPMNAAATDGNVMPEGNSMPEGNGTMSSSASLAFDAASAPTSSNQAPADPGPKPPAATPPAHPAVAASGPRLPGSRHGSGGRSAAVARSNDLAERSAAFELLGLGRPVRKPFMRQDDAAGFCSSLGGCTEESLDKALALVSVRQLRTLAVVKTAIT
ncbi:MAG: hypothetical protein IT425_00055 [Pirellulales bacterium]|nr:hypothetical protein [Pirellulales bacterium]